MAVPQQSLHTAFIALGSNLGDRRAHLDAAVQALADFGRVSRVSSFYDTEPVGDVAQPDFLNAVAELHTTLPPQELLAALLSIEQQHGRDRGSSPPKGPRTLDLDLLSYDAMALDTPSLTLPHPALAERVFVLQPLAEIAPHWRHPVSGKLVSQLLTELSGPKRPRQH